MSQTTVPEQVDVAIVGGGMAGLSLALLLHAHVPDYRVLVLEARPAGAASRPSFDDRSTALSESSRAIYQDIGVWPALAPRTAAIESIHVSDRGHLAATRLSAREHGLDGLGHVVENRVLGQELQRAAATCDNLIVLDGVAVDDVVPDADGMTLSVDGRPCRARLAVAADGANSGVLRRLGIGSERREYGVSALIANVALDRPHGGVAYERFTETGPMALLPLPDLAGEHRAALVWTLAPERCRELAGNDEAEFLAALQETFGTRAGLFRRVGTRVSFPLGLVTAREQVRRHLAVVGNAAHTLHPVAGQGFNLSLRDLARLAQVLARGARQGRPPGDLALLQEYERARAGDQQRTILFSDVLPRLFGAGPAPLTAGRNLGLLALDLTPGLRRGFGAFGAGLINDGVRRHGP